MGKLDWRAGDTGTRTNMNRPLWVASGTVAAGGDPANSLRLMLSPGFVRYPYQPSTVGSGQPQSVLLLNAAANTYYTLFMRSDGTFIVSGSTSVTVPGPPRWDAEYLGTVFTGGTLNTANLTGPWNQGAFDKREQRGEVEAITAARQRIVWDQRSAGGSDVLGAFNVGDAPSGIAYLSLQNFRMPTVVTLHASIYWIPSGKISGSPAAVTVSPGFGIQTAIGPNLPVVRDSICSPINLNPDSVVAQNFAPKLTQVTQVDTTQSGTGYSLVLNTPDNMRIASVTFVAILGYAGSNLVEPS